MSSGGERLAQAAYVLATHAALPVLAPYALVKAHRRGERLRDLAARLGLGLGGLAACRDAVWLHGVSYGEVGVARRLGCPCGRLRERGLCCHAADREVATAVVLP